MKFAIWCAVSTETQASPDKVSLAVQEQQCTALGHSRGWTFVRAYTVPGESRTAYASLYHAEKQIPQLHDLLEAASRHEFDLLILYDLNRFRSLMLQVFDVLSDYNVQLYILSDPREPVPPDCYTDEIKSTTRLTVSLRDIISDSEVNNLRRHYRDKMPRRITDKGLHAGLGPPPYGYRKPPGHETDRAAVLEQIPDQVAVILHIRDQYLAGISLTQIARDLNDRHIPPPRGHRWWVAAARFMLTNPYYAGIVTFGKTHRIRNRRDGTVHRIQSQPVTAPGKHIPIWDIAVHRQILAELHRRNQSHAGTRTRQLSRLLRCWCGATLWAQHLTESTFRAWRCSTFQHGHISIRDDIALTLLTQALQHALQHLDDLQLPVPQDRRPSLRTELRDLAARRKRWLDAYELSALDLPTLSSRLTELDTRIIALRAELERAELSLAQVATVREQLKTLTVSITNLPDWLHTAPPSQVNALLHRLFRSITVNQDKTLTLNWLQ